MMRQIIEFPSSLDLTTSLAFADRLSAMERADVFSIDFGKLKMLEPFGMLYACQAIRSLAARFPDALVLGTNIRSDACNYAGHMGFFRACGIEFGKPPGAAKGSDKYLPITYRPVDELARSPHVGRSIQQLAEKLAGQLLRTSDGSLFDAVAYSFREIIRNVAEHSQSQEFGYCAQYWESRSTVEIGIIDTGVGLRATLSRHPRLDVQSDRQALQYALMPGVSSKVIAGVEGPEKDRWANAGYGLYMNSRLCSEGGNFFICSGTTGLLMDKDSGASYCTTQFQGTVLRLRMNTSNIRNTEEMLHRFSKEGEAISVQAAQGIVPSAPQMSQLIREDFAELVVKFTAGDQVRHHQYGQGIVVEVIHTPQGEMLAVRFAGGREKRVLSHAVDLLKS